MGYKVLGFVVWHGAKSYLGRRYSGVPAKAAIVGAGAAILAGVVLAGRRATGHDDA